MNKELIDKVKYLISKEIPITSNLANLSRVIYEGFANTCWAGFYICDNTKNVMYLGPFQGPVACTTISYSRGVCGACVRRKEAILVPNVHEFDGHIACYSLTNSEVVVPIIKDNTVIGVIDLDSINYNNYNDDDVLTLLEIAKIVSELY